MNVYGAFNSLYAVASLSAYLDYFARDGEFKFHGELFQFCPTDVISSDVLLVYQPTGKDYLHGYYVRTEDVSKYDEKFSNAVRPIYDYLNSGEFYAFTPFAAKEVARDYYYAPLKKIYQYYSGVDLHHQIPVVILVPTNGVSQPDLEDLILIAEYEVTKNWHPSHPRVS